MTFLSLARALRETTSSRAFRVARSVGSLSLGLSLVGCSFAYCDDATFSRDRELRHGEIAGTALLPGPEEKPAAFVQASVQGTSFVRRTNSEGRFVFSGLEEGPWIVTVSEDDNGDGKAERRRIVSAVLRTVPHRTSPSYVPLVGGAGEPQLAGVDVGNVLLEGTVRVSGRVLLDEAGTAAPPSQHGRVAVVVVGRNLDLPRLESDGTDLVSLGAEAKTGVDDQGNFVLRNVSGGDFYLLVLIYELGTPGQPGALLHVSAPVAVSASGDVEIEQDIIIPAEALTERRPAQLVFSPPPVGEEQVYLVLVPPGRELPPCEDAPVDYSGTPFAYALTTAQIPASATPQFQDVPVGLWDMQACFTSSPPGTLFAQTITPPVTDEPPVLLGPVLLSALPSCVPARPCDAETPCADGFSCDEGAGRCVAPEGWSDCDGDDARGLPRIEDDDDRALWSSCVGACFEGAGAAAADTTCTASDGNDYDCDDDGDGQPDVTESQDCYGVGRGTDSDGDGICDGTDPFPECRANTAADCEAGAEPDAPSVPSDYGSGEDPQPEMCEAQRTSPLEGGFCAAVGMEGSPTQCSESTMSCSIDTQFRGPVVVIPRCDAATQLGCESHPGTFCAPDLAGDDGVAPCVQPTEVPCEIGVEGACPEYFTCAQVQIEGLPQGACVSDLAAPEFQALVYSQVDCTCCRAGEECHVVPHTRDVRFPGACSDDELTDLWGACMGTSGGSDTEPDAGPGERCLQDGFCDESCDPTDPDCEAIDDPDGGVVPPTLCSETRTITEFWELQEVPLGTADCLTISDGSGVLAIVGDSFLTDLDLADVRHIFGSVLIQNNDSLTGITATNLEAVHGSLTIDDNGSLFFVDTPALSFVDGDVGIWRNPQFFVDARIASLSTSTGNLRVSANGCSGPDACGLFGTPYCGFVGIADTSVCYSCLDDSVCTPDICDVNYTDTAGTGTFTCTSTGADGEPSVDGGQVP